MPAFFILIGCIYIIANIYIYIRGGQALAAQSFGVKVLLSVIFWCAALSLFVGLMLRHVKLASNVSHTIHEIGTGWLAFTFYMVCFLLIFDILKVFNIVSKYGVYLSFFLTLCLLSFGYYNYQHPKKKVINISLNKPVENNQQSLRIVAVSDVHLGYGTNKAALKEYVSLINAENPDLILIGGDLIDNNIAPLVDEEMHEELNRLHAPLGVFMVPGNHEYISDIRKSVDFLEQTQIYLLRDSVVTLPNGVQLVGRDDRIRHTRMPLSGLIENIDLSKPVILLDHQPYELAETQKAGVDLQFSGHTHRGQFWPLSLLVDQMFEQSYGYKQWGDTHIYVSSGLSLWGPPFRIGTDSELVIFNLTFNGK